MSTPTLTGVIQPRTVLPGQIEVDDRMVAATVIDGKSAAVHHLVQVLGEIVHRSGSFHTEKDLEDAMNALRTWERLQVAQSTLASLLEMAPHRAEVEDVTKRIPPTSGLPVQAALPVQFDYNKLAAAILALQAGQAPEDAA